MTEKEKKSGESQREECFWSNEKKQPKDLNILDAFAVTAMPVY